MEGSLWSVESSTRVRSGFRAARRAARNSDFKKQSSRIGAALCKGSRFVQGGWNTHKTHPVVSEYTEEVVFPGLGKRMRFACIHAELSCLFRLEEGTSQGGTLYVWRSSSRGKPLNSKPCLMCQDIIRKYGVRKVYFTTDTYPFFGMMPLYEE